MTNTENNMPHNDDTPACAAMVEYEDWEKQLSDIDALVDRCVKAVHAHANACSGNACIMFTDDMTVQMLNERFRAIDKPTNVLSFGGDTQCGLMGDVALAYETVLRESEEKNIELRAHTAHLVIHGLLHLIGYDHEADDEADKMEAMETKILADLGIENPYKDN